MYLIFTEDGEIYKRKDKKLNDETFKASDLGVISIIDISVPEKPLEYRLGKWVEVED